jgi:hypothetical protein
VLRSASDASHEGAPQPRLGHTAPNPRGRTDYFTSAPQPEEPPRELPTTAAAPMHRHRPAALTTL